MISKEKCITLIQSNYIQHVTKNETTYYPCGYKPKHANLEQMKMAKQHAYAPIQT